MNEVTEELVKAVYEAEATPAAPPPVVPNRFEIRGYELCKLMSDGSWYVVGKYRDNEIALGQANAAATALNRSWVNERYTVRAIISAELPQVPKEPPLVLEADEEPAPSTESDAADDSTPNEELNA